MGISFQWTTSSSQYRHSKKNNEHIKIIRDFKAQETENLTKLQLQSCTWSLCYRMCRCRKAERRGKGTFFQILKPKFGHLFVTSFFFFELGSMRFSSDFAFLSRVLPASFRSSASRLFSSSKSGLAIPSFSSLNLRTFSKISIASSTLKCFDRVC